MKLRAKHPMKDKNSTLQAAQAWEVCAEAALELDLARGLDPEIAVERFMLRRVIEKFETIAKRIDRDRELSTGECSPISKEE